MVFVNIVFVFVNFEPYIACRWRRWCLLTLCLCLLTLKILQVEEMVKKLQQEARDGVEEKKIGERKSVAMVSAILFNSNFL